MADSTLSVEVSGLSHRYRNAPRFALSAVELTIRSGERVGLLGHNGAGKTTLMRILCAALPTSDRAARVRVCGRDVGREPNAVRRRVGYLPELVPLHLELRVAEYLAYRALLKDVGVGRIRAEVARVAEAVAVGDVLGRTMAELSRGYRQRVGIADALLGDPELVILDEPTVGLDPTQVAESRALLRSLGHGKTLVFSSHVLAEVEAVCDRVVILAEGRVALDADMAAALRTTTVEARWAASAAEVEGMLAELSTAVGPVTIVPDGAGEVAVRLTTATAEAEVLVRRLGRESAGRGLVLTRLELGRAGLEHTFAAIVAADATGSRRS